jgi:fatty acid desaturase
MVSGQTVVPSLTSTIVRPATVNRLTSRPTPGQLRLKIDEHWYDLTKWQHNHPGGHEILQHLNGLDATDAFYSLHSAEAHERLKKFHRISSQPGDSVPPTKTALAFRKFRKQLVEEGFFKRSFFWEAFYQLSVYVLCALGSYLSRSHPLLAVLLIGIGMEQAGWIGHDNTHGRGKWQNVFATMQSGVINSFSRSWWSNKHNHHHVYTNHLGLDVDIENDPIIHLFFPSPDNEVFYRKFQHIYFPMAASFLYVSWRIQSLQWALQHGNLRELFYASIGYIWLYFVGFWVALGSIMLGGFLVGMIVTVTHQSEDMIDCPDMSKYSYVEAQFRSTRDAFTTNPFMNWIWGGMQYQLEHHLFPTMPKYWYPSLIPRVKKFAEENGIEYRVDTVWEVWRRNMDTLKFFAGPLPEEAKMHSKKVN